MLSPSSTSRRVLATVVPVLLAASALAQCPSGSNAGLVAWDAGAGYAGVNPADDEGISGPPIALTAFASFPMAGAAGTLDQLWVGSNGELYLTDSSLGLSQPVGGALYGVDTLAEMRGNVAGASARIVVLGGDHEASVAAGAAWEVSVDQSMAGEVRVTWRDMTRWNNTADRFSFACRLFASGAVEFTYGDTFPAGFAGRFVGISIGDQVGAGEPSSNLSTAPNSGTTGLLYQNFSLPGAWDLAGTTLSIAPNGVGGYVAAPLAPYTPPECAFHQAYGAGCYDVQFRQAVYETWPNAAASAAALPSGTSITYTPTGTGYVVTNGGGTFVAPPGSATVLPLTDDAEVGVTPSVAFPYLGGAIPTLAVCSNGFVSMAAAPSGNDTLSYGTAPQFLAQPVGSFRSYSDYNPQEPGSGQVKVHEATDGPHTVLYVTWDGVERFGAAINPETFQFQFTLAGPSAGRVVTVWQSMTTLGSLDLLVGHAPAAPNLDPGAISFASQLPVTTAPDGALPPLTLSASPRPVLTLGGLGPSVPMTWTIDNVPEGAPGTGFAAVFLMFSLGQIAGGIDLGPAGIDLGMGGCRAYVPTIDIAFFAAGTVTTVQIPLTVPQPIFVGQSLFSQAMALFLPNSLPNGQNAFGAITSNGVQSFFEAQ